MCSPLIGRKSALKRTGDPIYTSLFTFSPHRRHRQISCLLFFSWSLFCRLFVFHHPRRVNERMAFRFLVLAALACSVTATVYFKEDFADDGWQSRWVQSKHSGKELGEFVWTAGKFYGDAEKDKGKYSKCHSKWLNLTNSPFSFHQVSRLLRMLAFTHYLPSLLTLLLPTTARTWLFSFP